MSISSLSGPSILQETVWRRRLNPELEQLDEIRDLIDKSGLNDEMTRAISLWQERFLDALKKNSDKEDVFNTYVALLQEILRDPVTHAPLGPYAMRGSDGHTYDQLSLAVYVLSVPKELQTRSPLDPGNPARFVVVPHPVVRHMVQWLQKHNALLYSEELEKKYLSLLPQQKPMDKQSRIDRILERKAELDKRREEERARQTKEFAEGLQSRSEKWSQGIEQKIDEMDEKGKKGAADLQARIERMKGLQKIDGLNKKLDALPPKLEEVQQQLNGVAEKDKVSFEKLKQRIQTQIEEGFKPLVERVERFAEKTLAKIEKFAEQDRKALSEMKQSIQKLEIEIVELEKGNKALGESQQKVSQQLEIVKREEVALKQGIYETKVALQEMKENQKNKLFQTVAIVGVSFFATWAISAYLQSAGIASSVQAGVFSTKGGAGLGVRFLL